MKAAAVAIALASLATPALALASARPGEGFRILRRADGKDCVEKANGATASGPCQGQVQASQENPEYPPWITLQMLCSSESDQDGMDNNACKNVVNKCLEKSKKFNDIKDCVAKNAEYPPWITLQMLCSSESDRSGMNNNACKNVVNECLEESKKFNDIKDCVAKRN
ncbi:hypothetical protein H634G_09399 [Metarhizium anisopliae BRIP 53293]|uniref:IMS import disulfide relay-system CHCH-CHCH-like Cx9C domain-containing protein n=1 Tax=Metarhizium anisopliae BRIP 53293 TaxID=1291518 RepID=A0A0D9NN94_METAN|nr:hypothetical protein H634G_09399 [Metarhizium anisopliae BRIP 53293]KJK87237.1 hypothetical protein H633G_08901 [Metarhizium anisopliae BRIP 53284]